MEVVEKTKDTKRVKMAQSLAKGDGRKLSECPEVMKNAYLHNADVEIQRKESVKALREQDDPSRTIGLYFALSGKQTDEYSDQELWHNAKIAGIDGMPFPHTVTMPCGQATIFDDAEHVLGLGIEDIPCLCGNPTHYIVKFEDKRNGVLIIEDANIPSDEEVSEEDEGEKSRELNPGEYFCSKCKSIHRITSRKGKKHQKYIV